MGCDFSKFLLWRNKTGRKRLSSGDSEFRSDIDTIEFDDKSKNRSQDSTRNEEMSHIGRLKKMFSKRQSKPQPQDNQKKLPMSCDVSTLSLSSSPSTLKAAEVAVRNRNLEQLLGLIQNSGGDFIGLPVPSVPRRFYNPVELACSLGYYDIVQLFLDNGCSPNLPTSEGKLLHSVLASLKSHSESHELGGRVVRNLIQNGCDLDIKDRCGVTPLLYCAQIGDRAIMQAVLSQCSSKQLTCSCAGSSYTPLHMSAMRGDFECVKLLLSRSPHKHVNLKDRVGNTALHLALKSILHNIPYLNAARETIMLTAHGNEGGGDDQMGGGGGDDDSAQLCETERDDKSTEVCERLMQFQQQAVAIVEALVMAGAEVNVACILGPTNVSLSEELQRPLAYALQLCAVDHTQGFDRRQFSATLNLVGRQTIQSLEDLSKGDKADRRSEQEAHKFDDYHRFSPYAGVVRLLVLAGAEVSTDTRSVLFLRFEGLHSLLDEICAFWDKYLVSKPPKLVHLSKLKIRSLLADVHHLHKINRLPLPPRMLEYLKLNYL